MSEDDERRLPHIARRGIKLVLSSPSGAGKTTIARKLLSRTHHLLMSVSATTRPPRPGEIDGKDYVFLSDQEFSAQLEAGRFLEHACVFGNRYGTPRAPVEEALAKGDDVLFDVDWQGTQQLRQSNGADLVTVFILPPSHAELERRLTQRAQDPQDVVRARMAKAASEISHWTEYDYIVVNSDVEAAVRKIEAILAAERLRRHRLIGLESFIADLCQAATAEPCRPS
ncbi:MAG: guanylate kinase, partial [Rhodoplanes sp.]